MIVSDDRRPQAANLALNRDRQIAIRVTKTIALGLAIALFANDQCLMAAADLTKRKQEVQEVEPHRDPAQQSTVQSKYVTMSIRGQVVWMAEAIARRYGVKSAPEARERVIALESDDGTLYSILEDLRGSSFRKDKRLRGVPLELLVRRYDKSPMLQVIQVYSVEKEGKYELDYWCDICAIAMYELKPCDCCQGTTELRRRPVAERRPKNSPR